MRRCEDEKMFYRPIGRTLPLDALGESGCFWPSKDGQGLTTRRARCIPSLRTSQSSAMAIFHPTDRDIHGDSIYVYTTGGIVEMMISTPSFGNHGAIEFIYIMS